MEYLRDDYWSLVKELTYNFVKKFDIKLYQKIELDLSDKLLQMIKDDFKWLWNSTGYLPTLSHSAHSAYGMENNLITRTNDYTFLMQQLAEWAIYGEVIGYLKSPIFYPDFKQEIIEWTTHTS